MECYSPPEIDVGEPSLPNNLGHGFATDIEFFFPEVERLNVGRVHTAFESAASRRFGGVAQKGDTLLLCWADCIVECCSLRACRGTFLRE